jgi:hypothetical protein
MLCAALLVAQTNSVEADAVLIAYTDDQGDQRTLVVSATSSHDDLAAAATLIAAGTSKVEIVDDRLDDIGPLAAAIAVAGDAGDAAFIAAILAAQAAIYAPYIACEMASAFPDQTDSILDRLGSLTGVDAGAVSRAVADGNAGEDCDVWADGEPGSERLLPPGSDEPVELPPEPEPPDSPS